MFQGNKKIALILIIAVLILINVINLYFWWENKNDNQLLNNTEPIAEDCISKIEEKIVSGTSLSGVLEPGTKIKILYNYYQCHIAQREDIIVFQPDLELNPVVKIIKGLPGDALALRGDGKNWNILVNGEILKTSTGDAYQVNDQAFQMLSLYIRDYQGKIPPKAHLLLGNAISGSLDSTKFGLIDISDIIGKVVVN
jgi:signal peptidase I